MPMRSVRAIVFDLDDTLYREAEFVMGGFRAVGEAVAARHGIDIADELIALFRSGRRGDLFTPVLARHRPEVDEGYVKELVEIYRGHAPALSPLPGTRGVLEALRVAYPLGLITDGIAAVQRRKFGALGLGDLFDATIFTGDWGEAFWKPHPRPYEECARLLGLDASALAYVADNPNKDFVTARRLGWTTIRLRLPDGLHAATNLDASHEADREIRDLAELPGMLIERRREALG
jgi:putative hydrolase of the HAD superfamily